MAKKIISIINIFLLFLLLNGCYYLTQGCSLFSIYGQAQDIDEVLEKQELAGEELEFLKLVKSITDYAVNTLKLKQNKNYTKYVKTERTYLADVVSACASDSFDQYKWFYLFMGEMPYRGFFDDKDAKNEAERLKKEDYDVYLREVDAFSTLGILEDPIFSFMQNYSVYSLANMLIHEQTHATVFLSHDIDFSENLANFIGKEGALNYISQNYGEHSREYDWAVKLEYDSAIFRQWIQKLYFDLNKLYEQNISKQEKLESKKQIISGWKVDFQNNYKKEFKTTAYQHIPQLEINNAFIATFRNYTKDLSLFYELYDLCNKDLIEFIKIIKQLDGYSEDPDKYIKRLIYGINNINPGKF